MIKELKIGEPELDRLLTAYTNAAFDCGAWDDEDEEREHLKYEDCFGACAKAQEEFIEAVRARLGLGKPAATGKANG